MPSSLCGSGDAKSIPIVVIVFKDQQKQEAVAPGARK
jgi:protein involved in sex pheromone biosynthesis